MKGFVNIFAKRSHRIIKLLLYPAAFVYERTKEGRANTLNNMVTVENTVPVERHANIVISSNMVGILIPIVTGLFGILANILDNVSLATQITFPVWTFLLSSFVALSMRLSPANADLKRYKALDDMGKADQYRPDQKSFQAIPTDQDFIIPLAITLIVAPIVWASRILVF